MAFSDWLLYHLSKRFRSPVAARTARFGGDPASEEYGMAYASDQFDRWVRDGLGIVIHDKEVLEIGCGHGGITCFCAMNGARRALGLDLDQRRLEFADRFSKRLAARLGAPGLPVEWLCASASKTGLPAASIDVVYTPNVWEHFMEPEKVLAECHRILRPEGIVHVPIFSSIYCIYGTHLKHAIWMPNANLFFSEPTIIRTVQRMARERPELYDVYPGLATARHRIREVRKHGDLNDMTFRRFKRMARDAGFRIKSFQPHGGRVAMAMRRIPGLRNTLLMDACSYGARTTLVKPKESTGPPP